jgi:cobalt-zinc-cadmium efflux system outer membrane protein
MHFAFRAGALALLCASVIAPAGAESLDFVAAAQRTLQAHPDTRRLAAELEAARARTAAAELRPPLELGVELENFAGTGAASGVDVAEATLSLGATLERAARRGARVDAAQRAVDLLTVDQRVLALDRLAETGRRFVAVAVAQQRVTLARVALAQADTTLALIRPRVAAARSPRTELLNAEIERSQAEAELTIAERDLAAAQAGLGAQWAAPDARPTVRFALLEFPEPADRTELRRALETTPDLERYATEARLADARVALARAQATPDWRWSLGVRRLQESRDQALVVGFTVPLGNARRADPEIRERRAEVAQVDAAAAARRVELERLLIAELERLHGLHARLLAITDVQLPRAREARELTERGYRIGRFPYRELSAASRQVIDLELARLEAASQYHLTRVEVERLTGARIDLLSGTTP